jgi:hypothetical protein
MGLHMPIPFPAIDVVAKVAVARITAKTIQNFFFIFASDQHIN